MPDNDSLELRLEYSKRISNLRLDFLKRLDDQGSIAESYCRGIIELHVHFASHGMWCAAYRDGATGEAFVKRRVCASYDVDDDVGDLSVFVWIREVSEGFRPITSFVRLQPLNACNMATVHASKPRLAVRPETIFAIFNQELCAGLGDARIKLGEFKDEVVKGGSEVATDFADQDGDPYGSGNRRDNFNIIRRFCLELSDNGIFVFLPESLKPSVEVRKVFSCPVYSFERAIEYIRSGNGF
jgi:hypothetical protein